MSMPALRNSDPRDDDGAIPDTAGLHVEMAAEGSLKGILKTKLTELFESLADPEEQKKVPWFAEHDFTKDTDTMVDYLVAEIDKLEILKKLEPNRLGNAFPKLAKRQLETSLKTFFVTRWITGLEHEQDFVNSILGFVLIAIRDFKEGGVPRLTFPERLTLATERGIGLSLVRRVRLALGDEGPLEN